MILTHRHDDLVRLEVSAMSVKRCWVDNDLMGLSPYEGGGVPGVLRRTFTPGNIQHGGC